MTEHYLGTASPGHISLDDEDSCGANLVLFDFNLVLPDAIDLGFEIPNYNNEVLGGTPEREFYPEVTMDQGATMLGLPFADTYTQDCCSLQEFYLYGEVSPVDGAFHVLPTICDYTDNLDGYRFVEYLCEKYSGTMIAVYIHKDTLFPVKIVNGKRLNVRLAMVSEDSDAPDDMPAENPSI